MWMSSNIMIAWHVIKMYCLYEKCLQLRMMRIYVATKYPQTENLHRCQSFSAALE